MSRPIVEQLLYLLDEAFAGEDWHSLLAKVRTVSPEAWGWVPPGGHRSIRAVVQHVGGCKLMDENHAFGDATFDWNDPLVAGDSTVTDSASLVEWLGEAHARLRQSIAGLDDAELDGVRMTNWGEPKDNCDDDPARLVSRWGGQPLALPLRGRG